jgi:hypothetical protein
VASLISIFGIIASRKDIEITTKDILYGRNRQAASCIGEIDGEIGRVHH